MAKAELPTKPCSACGRTITWRKKWERDWAEVRYCSEACRRRARSGSASSTDAELERVLLALLDARPARPAPAPARWRVRSAGRTGAP